LLKSPTFTIYKFVTVSLIS